MKKLQRFGAVHYIIFTLLTIVTAALCICLGSVNVRFGDTVRAITYALFGSGEAPALSVSAIIIRSRIPRVICVAVEGAALSLCGGAMQGLLRNPLADGSTLGVSAGASLGAVLSIAFGISIPFLPAGGTMVMAMLFAFGSMLLILALAYRLDYSLSTNTIILIGVIFSMFVNSIMSLVITFAGEKVKTIMFWTMGSLSGTGYSDVLTLLAALVICGTALLLCSRELDAFAIGEDNARHIGINVRRTKLIILIFVSALIGVCVSVAGTIGFIGLVIPHMTRMITGPAHRKLLPASMFGGAIFLMLADLVARTVLRPLELPIGVVTSFVGSIAFIYIFYRTRKGM